jgi:lysozyme
MITGNKGINLIKEFESLHDGDLKQIGLQPKMCPAMIWSEGYGRAMRDERGNFIKGAQFKSKAYANTSIHNEAEAITALQEDLKARECIVAQNIKVPLTQNQFDALVSYVYNTGGSGSLYRLINTKAPAATIRNWFETKYITAAGRKLPGLVRRRKAEADLYFTP